MVVYMLAVVAFGLFGCCYTFVGIVLVFVCFIRVHKFVDLIQPGLLCWTLLDSVGLC